MINTKAVGDTVTITVQRGGETHKLKAKLQARPGVAVEGDPRKE